MAEAGPRLAAAIATAFLMFALCKDSGLSGLVVRGELKLGFRECCRPLMTEVWRWCRFEVLLCKPVSRAIGFVAVDAEAGAGTAVAVAGGSVVGMVGWAEAVLEETPVAWGVAFKILPLVTEASLD